MGAQRLMGRPPRRDTAARRSTGQAPVTVPGWPGQLCSKCFSPGPRWRPPPTQGACGQAVPALPEV